MANKSKLSASQRSVALKGVLHRLKPYRLWVVLSLFCAAVSTALTIWLPLLIGDGVDLLVGPGQVDFARLIPLIVFLLIVIVLTGISQWLMNLCNNHITYCVTRDIRRESMEKIQTLPLSYLDAHSHGDMISRIIADVDQFADGLLMGFTQLFTGVLTIVGTLILMFCVDVWISLAVVCLTPLSLFAAWFIAKRTYHKFQEQTRIRGRQTALVNEMVQNQKVVQAFGREETVQQEFDRINHRLTRCSLKAVFYSSLTNPTTRFVNNLVFAAVCIVGAFVVIAGGISVGLMSSMLMYAKQYTKPFNEISGVVTELQNALACAARVLELVNDPAKVEDAPDAGEVVPDGRVEIQNVSFRYVPKRPLIENFNLKVQPGQRVAIVGPTGCGKTTLINLLMRFYDVDSGTIKVADQDIETITRKSLRAGYGMVLQDTWLMKGTVRENIAFGKPEATLEEVVAAAKASYAHGFITRLPKGYDTVLGEDGGGLSQGQKQLLCIARVMLCLPPMLILDEATSSIDTRTERKIQDAFAKLMEGRTSFIVAHRLSTIREADVILVMRDGKIIEQGTHQSLLEKKGFYHKLYYSQFAT